MNQNAAWTAWMLIAALAAAPAQAGDQTPDDPALDLSLSQGRTSLPHFVMELEIGYDLDMAGDIRWLVNGQQVDLVPVKTQQGRWVDLEHLDLTNDALVCVEVAGQLTLGGVPVLPASERACMPYEHERSALQPTLGERSLSGDLPGREPRLPSPRPVRR